jgi:hypothetical protein
VYHCDMYHFQIIGRMGASNVDGAQILLMQSVALAFCEMNTKTH